MFHVRTIYPEQRRAETSTHPFTPSDSLTRHARSLFDKFFIKRPAQFRDNLDFVDNERVELEWMAGPGDGGFAAIYASGNPVSISMLIPAEAGTEDREALLRKGRELMLPILREDTDRLMKGPGYPLLVVLLVPGRPDLRATLDILQNALAAFYFPTISAKRRECERHSRVLYQLPQVVEWDLPR